MIDVRRAAQRYRDDAAGITSWHCFSSGRHYDAENLSFGGVVACDDHLLDPGAGFEKHPHARVELVTWVVEGTLLHVDATGRRRMIIPGQAQYQLAGAGIEHSESNASRIEPLRFVQLWLVTDEDVPDYDVGAPPLTLTSGTFAVHRRCRDTRLQAAMLHLYVATGNFHTRGYDLAAGDSVRASGQSLTVDGDGELLVLATA